MDKFTKFVVLMGAFGSVFTLCMTGAITLLAVRGEFPWSLVVVVYGVIALGSYAIYKMTITQKAFLKNHKK